jgi:acyl-CoA synthetase (AMP-forming)/AMP-acid ligase II
MMDTTTSSDALQRPAALVSGPALDHDICRRTSLADALAHAAAVRGDGTITCIADDGTERVWTYRELDWRARHAAAALHARGVVPGSRVVLRLADPWELVLGLWTCFAGGLVAISTYSLDELPDDVPGGRELAGALRVLDPAALIVSDAEWARARALADAHGWPHLAVLTTTELDASPAAELKVVADLDRVAIIFPTSGSTGTPKPVTQTERALLAMAAGSAQMNGFDAGDVFLNWMPMDHVGSVAFLAVLPTCVAADQVIVAHRRVRADLLGWIDLLSRTRASVGWVPNHVFTMAAQRLEREPLRDWDLSAMRFLVNAGESINPAFVRLFSQRLRERGLRENAVRPAFGMSETCSGITWSAGLGVVGRCHVDLGAPIPGAELRVVSGDGQVLGEGEVGRLHLRGPSVTRGYFRVPPDEKFLADGWFDTGDSAFVDSGRLFLTDREGDGIDGLALHGHELEEAIELLPGVLGGHTAVCSTSLEGVRTLAVFHCPDPAHADAGLQGRIEALLRRLVPQVPFVVTAVRPQDLPRTSIGKIQRKVLRRRFEQRAR